MLCNGKVHPQTDICGGWFFLDNRLGTKHVNCVQEGAIWVIEALMMRKMSKHLGAAN